MGRRKYGVPVDLIKKEQIERGTRIKNIRLVELRMNKTQLANKLDTSSQFLGFVEAGKGNLNYSSIKKLCELSGHSADYILFGLDDEVVKETKEFLKDFSMEELLKAIDSVRDLTVFLKAQ